MSFLLLGIFSERLFELEKRSTYRNLDSNQILKFINGPRPKTGFLSHRQREHPKQTETTIEMQTVWELDLRPLHLL